MVPLTFTLIALATSNAVQKVGAMMATLSSRRTQITATIDRLVFCEGGNFKLGAVLAVMLLFAGVPALAKTSSLAGSWGGGGWVSFASGTKEKARCRARYTRAGADSYELHATCATASGSASQTATVHEVSPNRFRGSFHNPEYNVSGSIRVVVRGNSQSVTLSGDSGSASLTLSRR